VTNSFLNNRKSRSNLYAWFLILMLAADVCLADHTQNILLTGYWPPTNEMLRKFSTDPNQNPGGWQGQNWQGLGYNIYAYFPEFPGGTGSNPKGNGDFEIDYQDVGSWQPPAAPTGDFWRITGLVHPVAIMSYGQGTGPWEMEFNARNLPSATWDNDYLSPTKPTPAPPDTTQASGYVRHSSLPLDAIAEAVNSSGAGINAWIDWDVDPGHFLCEYMAYHDAWYQSIHGDPCDQYYCVAAGFTHLAAGVSPSNGTTAVEAALRALISQLDSQLVQYTVSGTVTAGGSPLAGVTMCGLPGNPVTNASGIYTAQVGGGWSGVVTPLKSGYAFTQKTYSNVRANQSAQDYTTSAATADTIAFDAASSASGSSAATTLSWSHTVGSGNNRVLVVGVVAEDSVVADQIISSVKFNGVNMTAVSGSTKSRVVYSGSSYSSTLRTDLYYMLNPPVGTYTVLITYNGSVSYRVGGAVSLTNVKQQAPEAVAANAATATAISTTLTVPNSGAWIVDVVGHSNSGSFTTSTATERWDKNSGNHTGACSTKAVTTPGSNTITWIYSGSSGTIVHSLAAFAPSETVAPSPPGKATSPSPANSATGIGVTTDLSWTAGSGATSHLVYFGTVSPGTYQGEQTGNTFDTGTMANGTTYYWRIDEKNAGGTTTGDAWSFTTIIAAPGAASNPNPAAGATNVSVTQDLSWTAGSGATSHDVYFGTTSPGTFRGNQTSTIFDTGTMANGTTYYWRIDEKNAGGVTTTGTVWSFTTIYKRTLTSSSTAGGNVTTPGEGAFQYDNGTVVNLVATNDAHYHFVNWTGTAVTAGKVGNPNSANTTVTMDGDYTVIANFAIDQQSLTTSTSTGGTVTTPGIGTYWYNYGANANIVASASVGYHFVNWTGTGVTAGKVTNPNSAGTTITMDANYAVQANFAINQYTIIASAGPGGNISPAGDVTKNYGSNQMFTATPDTGYTVDKWTVDGNEVQTGGTTYTLNNITAAHTISVTFLVQTFYITAMADANGSINPCWTFGRDYGSSQLFIATPNTGYAVDKWTVDDNDVQTGGNTYTLSTITATHTVSVTFKIQTFTLGYTAGSNGTLTGQTSQVVNYGSNGTAVTAAPNTGYHFVKWSDDSTANPRIDLNVTANIAVTASFAIDTFTLTYTAGANGTISGISPQTVNYGASGTAVAAIPALGHHFVNWSDGSMNNPRIDTNVTANISVTANFSMDCGFTLDYTAGPHGAITGNTSQSTCYGGDGTAVMAVPEIGYHFVNWSDASTANPRTDLNVTANISVTANFAIDTFTVTASAGANGSVDPTSAVVNYNGSQLFTATPDTGYEVNEWFVDGSGVQTGGTAYTLENVTTTHTVSVTFSRIMLSISGYVVELDGITPAKDVLMSAGDTNTLTDANGYYELAVDYGWSGVITLGKEGYVFEPNSDTYADVNHNYSDINYTATLLIYKIAGYVFGPDHITPVSDVNLSAENGGGPWTSKYGTGSSLTDSSGYYEVWVDYNWSGKVTPAKYAYAFEPNGIIYADINSDWTNQEYIATLLTFKISGCIRNECNMPIAGVMVSADNDGGQNITGTNGLYDIWVSYAWSGTVTPEKLHYTFNPAGLSYIDVLADQADKNYAANNIYDLDCDGSIGIGDLGVMAENWLMAGPQIKGDFVPDETVNFLDFAEFGLVW
jgi:hypothetical protein